MNTTFYQQYNIQLLSEIIWLNPPTWNPDKKNDVFPFFLDL